jgi:hypothetical protein
MPKLLPRCIYPDKNGVIQGIAYNSSGYLLPCCWLDGKSSKDELQKLGIFDEELKLEKNQTEENIILSKQWKNFIKIIVENEELAPKKCFAKCEKL